MTTIPGLARERRNILTELAMYRTMTEGNFLSSSAMAVPAIAVIARDRRHRAYIGKPFGVFDFLVCAAAVPELFKNAIYSFVTAQLRL